MPVNEEPTLFSRLGDREFWEERDSEDLEKKKEAKYLQDFYENPLIDEQDIALLQPFTSITLTFIRRALLVQKSMPLSMQEKIRRVSITTLLRQQMM